MKKFLATLLIVTLMLGTFLSMAMASTTSTVLSANDDEDDHEPEEGNDVIGDEESNEDDEEGTGGQGGSEENEEEDSGNGGTSDEEESGSGEESGGADTEEEEGSEEGAAEEAEEAIREAEEQILKASGKIEEAEEKGLDITNVQSLLVRANNTLSDARAAYGEGNYEEAEQLAEEAKHLAERTKHLAEDILGKSGETEHSGEEEDEEEHEELRSEEDEEGNLIVTSTDNTIKFEKDKPKIDFEYVKNGTEIEFSADDFALVEFVDRNRDGKIQDHEISRVLELDDVEWAVTPEETTEGDNTIITVTYYASSDEYEITLIMYVYQRSTTGSSATLDGTVVFDVDGGADEVKFDLIVSQWTWDSDSDADSSKLALFMSLEAEVEGEVSSGSAGIDEDQITVELDDIGIQISWVKKAEVDGELLDVAVTYESWELEGGGGEVELELDVYFVYPHFENSLVHDPSIGIEDDPILYVFTLITPELLIGTGITAIAIVTAAIALTRRRKRPPFPGVFTTNWYIYRMYTPITSEATYEEHRKSS